MEVSIIRKKKCFIFGRSKKFYETKKEGRKMGKVEMVSIPKTTLETAETLEDLEDHKTAVKFKEYQEEMFLDTERM